MQLLDLLNQEYPSRSLDQNQSQLINMYLELDKSKGKYQIIALPTPGLTLIGDTGQANVRTVFNHNGTLYAIAGNQFGTMASNGTWTQIGPNLSTSSGNVRLKVMAGGADSNNQIVFIDGTNGYSYNVGTNTATFPIADGNFPQTAIDIASQDDYILAANRNSIKFNQSNLSDSLTWNSLNFANKISQADDLVAILSHESKVWLMGSKTSEIWYNSGAATFPWAKDTTVFLHYGCMAAATVIENQNYLMLWGVNKNGGYTCYQTLPRIYFYNPAPVSPQPIDFLVNSFSVVSDAYSYLWEKNGHQVYETTFPTGGYTFCYDVPRTNQSDTNLGAWFLRQSGTSVPSVFRGSSSCFWNGMSVIGDSQSGKIYYQDDTNFTENGSPILRQFVTPPIYKSGLRVFLNRLQIDVETGIGSNKTFTLEKSMDNGNTWSLVNTYTVGNKGTRIIENRLGSSRFGILLRIKTTMNAKFILLGFQAEIDIGES